jgi:hypothetical protein
MKNFKIVFFISLLFLTFEVFTYTSGPGGGSTNAPGETPCGGCHGPAITSGTQWNGMSLTTTTSLASLQPNTTYPMTLSFTSSTSNKIGFLLCALPSSAIISTGSLGTIGITNSVQTQSTVSGNRNYIQHTANGTSTTTGFKSWTFNYTTPNNFNGGVTFYVCVNATNGNSSTSGDDVFAKAFSVNVLPVRWLDMSAENQNNKTMVNWSTSMEVNTAYFEVEKGNNSVDFKSFAKVNAAGNSNRIRYYSISDDNIENVEAYYRIKQVDNDGKFSYSKIFKSVVSELNSNPEFAFNDETKTLFVNSSEAKDLILYRLNGGIEKQFHEHSGNSFNMEGVQQGIYLIRFNNSQKVVKILIN